MENLKAIRKDSLINGLILGVVLLVIDIITLYILANSQSIAVIALSYLFGYLIIPLFAAVVLIKKLREKIGGYWSFRQATSGIFIMLLSAYILSASLSFAFIRHIEPTITLKAKDNFVNVFSNFMNRIDADTDKIDETVENIEKQFDSMTEISVSSVLSNLLSSIIVLFIAALIFAAIFKRETLNADSLH